MAKIIGVTVGTPISPKLIKEKLKPVTSVNGIEADENGNVEVEIPEGSIGEPGKDGISVTHSWSGTTLTVTSASGTSSADLKGDKGDPGETGATGQRGTGLLPVTTAPSAYTTAVNGLTPAYRIALSTVKTQASTTAVYAGDTVRYSYYHYPVIYVDSSYVYCGTRVSIRGATGAAGTTPVKGTDYFTDADKAEMVSDVLESLPETGGGSDWNASEGEPGHVLNRTHYIDPKGVFLEETDAEQIADPDFGTRWVFQNAPSLELGKTYTVVYNGVSFECVCQPAPAGFVDDPNAVALGNFAVVGGANTGEPFAMLISPAYGGTTILDLAGSTSVKVKILGEVVHKLPSKFLPDDMGVSSWNDLSDRPFYSEIAQTEVFPEDVVGISEDVGIGAPGFVPSPSFVIKEGSQYDVWMDETKYSCTAFAMEVTGYGEVTVFGNAYIVNTAMENTGEPFVALCSPAANMTAVIVPTGAETATFRIVEIGEVVHKLPAKYYAVAHYIDVVLYADGTVSTAITTEELRAMHKSGIPMYVKLLDSENPVAPIILPMITVAPYVISGRVMYFFQIMRSSELIVVQLVDGLKDGSVYAEYDEATPLDVSNVILTSPNGIRYRLDVDDDGNLKVNSV